jgi:hypothetical protein
MAEAKRDQNVVTTLLAVSNADGVTPVVLWADPTTHRLLVSATSSGITSLNGLTGATQTFTNDTNVTITSGGTAHVLGWSGTLSPARGGTGVANNAASTLTISGNFATTLTVSGITSVTLPTSGTLASTASKLSVFAATTSSELAGVISDETGSGSLVFATSPTLVTPVLGVASATTINKVTLTAPATGSTLTIADGKTATHNASTTFAGTDGKTLTISNSLTLAGTDATVMTFPSTSATIARTDAGQTFTGVQIMTSPRIITQISDTNGNASISIVATASAVNSLQITNAITGTAGPLIKPVGETNVDLRVGGLGTGKVAMQSSVNFGAFTAYFTETDNGNSGTADTIDWTLSNKQRSTLTGNVTFTFTAPPGPCSLVLKLIQDATGTRTVTWPATVHWSGGTAPTLTTTAAKVDIVTFYYDGTTYFGNSSLNYTA